MSRAIIGTSVVVLIFGGMSAEAQTPKSPELKVLDHFVGSWRHELVSRQANGDEKKSTETVVTKWSLQGQYTEHRVTDSNGKQTTLALITYDSDAGLYKNWSFVSSSARPILNTLRWNESKMTFTAHADLGNGITMQTTTHFIGSDRYEFIGIRKNASGNVLDEIKAKAFRTM